jgi:small subunit ribosomal protein S15
MLNKTKKTRVIKKFQTHEGDTGSAQVQIAILTEEVKELQGHLSNHNKDFSSRRGLIRKVHQRHKLLNYLMRDDQAAYEKLIKQLKLKRRQVKLDDLKRKIAEAEAEAEAKAEAKAEELEE